MLSNVHEYEERLLAPALVNFTGWMKQTLSSVSPSDMSCASHKWLLETIQRLSGAGVPVELPTLFEEIRKAIIKGKLPAEVNEAWLIGLATNSAGEANAGWYASAIKKNASQERLLANLKSLTLAAESGEGMEDILDQAMEEIRAYDGGNAKKPRQMSELTQEVYDYWDEANKGGDGIGYRLSPGGMKEAFGLLRPGEFVVVAGRPGSGKTELTAAIGAELAIVQRRPVLYISLEVEARDMAERVILMRSGLSVADTERVETNYGYRDAKIFDDDAAAAAVVRAMKEIGLPGDKQAAPYFVEDDSMMSIDKICNTARSWCRTQVNPAVVMVDYVGLIEIGNGSQRHDLAIGEITRKLKLLAKELGIVVFGLFQLSRKVEDRPNKRPILSDLRDSGSIEQDTDKAVMVYRQDAYDTDTPLRGLAELLNVKRRRGQPCNGYMNFINGHFVGIDGKDGQAQAAEQVAEFLNPQNKDNQQVKKHGKRYINADGFQSA